MYGRRGCLRGLAGADVLTLNDSSQQEGDEDRLHYLREGGREEGREGWREGGMKGGREGGREGDTAE